MVDKVVLDKDCSALSGHHENVAFRNCTFNSLNGLTLQNCDLTESKFLTAELQKALGLTVTLNCLSFNEVELSPLLFDLMLLLLAKTKGNNKKRAALIDVIGRARAHSLLTEMKRLEL